MRTFTLVLLLLCSSLSLADGSKIQFSNGWIKQLPPVVPMRAAYMQISNPTAVTVTISALQSDAFETVEMHESMMGDGMMKMIQLDSITLAPNSVVELKPGSKHLMLISPKRALNVGDKVELIINFSDKTTQTVQLEIRK